MSAARRRTAINRTSERSGLSRSILALSVTLHEPGQFQLTALPNEIRHRTVRPIRVTI